MNGEKGALSSMETRPDGIGGRSQAQAATPPKVQALLIFNTEQGRGKT